MALRPGQDSADHSSPPPATLNRLRHEGALERLEGRRATVHQVCFLQLRAAPPGVLLLMAAAPPRAAAGSPSRFPFWRASGIAHLRPGISHKWLASSLPSLGLSSPDGGAGGVLWTQRHQHQLAAAPASLSISGPRPAKLLSVFPIPISSLVSSCPRGGMWLLPAVAASVIP